MDKNNLLYPDHEKGRLEIDMISGRESMVFLRLSDRVFFPAAKSGVLKAQIALDRPGRTEYSYAIDYLKEIDKILPVDRKKGREIFTREVKAKIEAINKRWKGKGVNYEKDNRDSEKFRALLKKKKK